MASPVSEKLFSLKKVLPLPWHGCLRDSQCRVYAFTGGVLPHAILVGGAYKYAYFRPAVGKKVPIRRESKKLNDLFFADRL